MSVFEASGPDAESVEVARRSYLAYVDKELSSSINFPKSPLD